jgi:hypothetical protein
VTKKVVRCLCAFFSCAATHEHRVAHIDLDYISACTQRCRYLYRLDALNHVRSHPAQLEGLGIRYESDPVHWLELAVYCRPVVVTRYACQAYGVSSISLIYSADCVNLQSDGR